eukprot:8128931-Pyramimonas_sp.AAC.2
MACVWAGGRRTTHYWTLLRQQHSHVSTVTLPEEDLLGYVGYRAVNSGGEFVPAGGEFVAAGGEFVTVVVALRGAVPGSAANRRTALDLALVDATGTSDDATGTDDDDAADD